MNEGIKKDQEKDRWCLVPWDQMREVVRVLMFGSNKYADDNWQKVENAEERYFDACLRHLTAWKRGEACDEESGLSHLAHAVCCVLFMMWHGDKSKRLVDNSPVANERHKKSDKEAE